MERRYEARLEEMLEDAEVSPEMLEGMLNRLGMRPRAEIRQRHFQWSLWVATKERDGRANGAS